MSEAESAALAKRPEPDPAVLAVIAASLDATRPRTVVVEEAAPEPSAWRFSGRWWAQPLAMRRSRPGRH